MRAKAAVSDPDPVFGRKCGCDKPVRLRLKGERNYAQMARRMRRIACAVESNSVYPRQTLKRIGPELGLMCRNVIHADIGQGTDCRSKCHGTDDIGCTLLICTQK